jgi:predicted Zn-dependent protease
MGLSLVRQKRLGDAVPVLAKAVALRPDLPRYTYVHAVALREAGHGRQALDVLQRAHARYPAERDILVALAQYSRQDGDRAAAERWARKLAELGR